MTRLHNDNFTRTNHGPPNAGSITTTPDNPYPRLYSVVDGGSQSRQQSGSLGLDWKLGAHDVFSLSLDYTYFSANFSDRTFAIDPGRVTAFTANTVTGAIGAGGINITNSQRNKSGTTWSPAFRYWHRGPIWTLEGAAGVSHATNRYRDIDKGFFQSHSSAITGLNINYVGDRKLSPASFEVSRTTAGTTVPVDLYNVANYVIRSVGSAHIESQSVTSSARLSARRMFDLVLPVRMKVGVDYRKMVRDLGRESYRFPGGTWVGADRIALSPDDNSARYLDVPHATKPGPSLLTTVPWVSNFLLWDDYVANPSWVVPNLATAHTTRANASRFFSEAVSAGYLRLDTQLFRNRLSLTDGVRWEHTDGRGEGPLTDPTGRYQKDAAGNVVRNAAGQPVLRTTDALEQARLTVLHRASRAATAYAGWYPSYAATFHVTENLQARASVGRTIGRPNLGSIIPGITIPEPSLTGTPEIISVTNTALGPWTANNYAVGLEYYFSGRSAGSISIRTYRRDVRNFFVSFDTDITPEQMEELDLSAEYSNAIIRSTRNNFESRQRLYGTEFAYQQTLGFLPAAVGTLRVFANATHYGARPSDTGALAVLPGEIYNWGLNHALGRARVAINWNHVGLTRTGRIADTVTVGPRVWTYNAPITRVDASAEVRITRRFSLFAAAKNLQNRNRLTLRYGPNTPYHARFLSSSETGASWSAGVKSTF